MSAWPVYTSRQEGPFQKRVLAVIRRDSQPGEALLSAWQLADALVASGRYRGVKSAREAISSLALEAGKVVRSTSKEAQCLKRQEVASVSTTRLHCLVSSGDAIQAMHKFGGAAADNLGSDLSAPETGLSRLQVGGLMDSCMRPLYR